MEVKQQDLCTATRFEKQKCTVYRPESSCGDDLYLRRRLWLFNGLFISQLFVFIWFNDKFDVLILHVLK